MSYRTTQGSDDPMAQPGAAAAFVRTGASLEIAQLDFIKQENFACPTAATRSIALRLKSSPEFSTGRNAAQ